jgi:Tol biopolymer transport system component
MRSSLHNFLLFPCLLFGLTPQSSAQTQPRIFAEGVISTGDHESHPAFSPDGRMLMFVKMAPDLSKWTLFVSYDSNNGWSEPEIAPFSGQYWDADPFFTKDGKALYFISNRPAKPGDPPKPDFDIWKVAREESGWSDPVQLPPPINSESSEYYPTLADNGSMYFGSRREGGKGATDIYFGPLENGAYRTAMNIGEAINTSGNEFEPCIAADESFLIFMATPTEALDQTDLWISYHLEDQWTKALKLPVPFNSEAMEFSPKISLDGKQLFFSSSRNKHNATFARPERTGEMRQRIRSAGNGLLDIYQVDFSALWKTLESQPPN